MHTPTGQKRLVLASGSPRRKELLERLGLSFEVRPAEIDEAVRPGEAPRAYVERLAREKADAVAAKHPGAVVLAADTTVVLGGEVLGKPRTADEAGAMLQRLSGRRHAVLTAVAVAPTEHALVVETDVEFRRLTAAEISWYVRTGEPMDKAGSYAIQGVGGIFVTRIDGSHSNVIGLPLAETLELLASAGVAAPWEHRSGS